MFRSLFLFVFVFFLPGAGAVIVLKTKEKKALVLLEGVRTQKGAYFNVFDLDGNKKGMVQMNRVAKTKAIVKLKTGSIAKKWSLKPISEELAVHQLKKNQKRKARIARIHRDQIKRKVALKKKQLEKEKNRRLAFKRELEREKRKKLARMRSLEKKRKLARKKRAIKRKLASYSLEENVLEDLGEEIEPQSSEVLSYELPADSSHTQPDQEEYQVSDIEEEESDLSQEEKKLFKWGVLPRLEYNFMKVSPHRSSDYLMEGLGFGAVLSTVFSVNHFMDLGAHLGGKSFFVKAEEEECGQAGGCSLELYYASAGLNLKLHLLQFYGHKLWLMGEGILLQPIAYSNKVPNLTKESFSPFHGTMGGGLGVELNFGKLTLPISLDAHIYMPPTETTLTGSAGLQFGLFYKF